MVVTVAFEQLMRGGGEFAVQQATRFFMRDDPVHQSLRRIADKLTELQIPYAVAGGMSLVAHGYDRTTVVVDILLTEDGLKRAHAGLDGLGYVPPFTGSKNLRDTTTVFASSSWSPASFPAMGSRSQSHFPIRPSVSSKSVACAISGWRSWSNSSWRPG